MLFAIESSRLLKNPHLHLTCSATLLAISTGELAPTVVYYCIPNTLYLKHSWAQSFSIRHIKCLLNKYLFIFITIRYLSYMVIRECYCQCSRLSRPPPFCLHMLTTTWKCDLTARRPQFWNAGQAEWVEFYPGCCTNVKFEVVWISSELV